MRWLGSMDLLGRGASPFIMTIFQPIDLKKLNVPTVKTNIARSNMKLNTAKVHEIVSKITITNEAKPDIAQTLLGWVKDTVTNILHKDKF